MLRFALRRAGHGALVVALVTVAVFFASRVLSDPVRQILPIGATDAEQDAARASLGLDRSLATQFVDFVGDVVRLDFGRSIWQNVSARDLALDRLPTTLVLVGTATLLALLVCVPLGVRAAARPGSWSDRATSVFAVTVLSLPQFWLGAMSIYLFAVRLGWLPTSGVGGTKHLILPAVTLALTGGGRLALATRAAVARELRAPYVEAARAKGLPERAVLLKHVLRSAMVPVITVAMWDTVHMIAGASVVVETVFGYAGIGSLMIEAVQHNDLFLLQSVVFVITFVIVALSLVTDLVYRAADPRIELL